MTTSFATAPHPPVPAPGMSAPPAGPPATTTRPRRVDEIEGLRGLALALVVLFHLFGDGRVSGGVDVFLFLSGFLLTWTVVRSATAGRPIALGRRYARTLLRLVPGTLPVLAATGVMTYFLLPESVWDQTGREIVAALAWAENWELINSQLAYGAAGPTTSPVQHFWSLSLQGQFFLAWPLLLAVLLLIAFRNRVAFLVLLTAVTLAATTASFLYAFQLNLTDPAEAYFHSGARFWELGLGALLALVFPVLRTLPGALRTVLSWAGVGAIVASGFLVDGAARYPGPAALIPVSGAILVILAAGPTMTAAGADRFLALPPVRFLARISYALYLWHWPVLIAWLALSEEASLSPAGAAVVLGTSFLLAWLTQLAVIDPVIRLRDRLPTAAALLLPVIASGLVVAAAVGGVTWHQKDVARQEAAAQAALEAQHERDQQNCHGARALISGQPSCRSDSLGELVLPVGPVADDLSDPQRDCALFEGESTPTMCTYGIEGSPHRIGLIGNSHAVAWHPAVEDVATRHGYELRVWDKNWCQLAEPQRRAGSQDLRAECSVWLGHVLDEILAGPPLDLVITSQSSFGEWEGAEGDPDPATARRALLAAWQPLIDAGTTVVVVKDYPRANQAILDCVEDEGLDATEECVFPRDDSHMADVDLMYETAVATPGAAGIDLTEAFCDETRCWAMAGHIKVYRDAGHISATYAATTADLFAEKLLAQRLIRKHDVSGPSGPTTSPNPNQQDKRPAPRSPSPSPGPTAYVAASGR